MKGRDDDSAWAHQDDGEQLYTSVDSKRERRIVALGPPVQRTNWQAPLLAFCIGGGLAALFYFHGQKQTRAAREPSAPAAQAPSAATVQTQPAPAPVVAENGDSAQPPGEGSKPKQGTAGNGALSPFAAAPPLPPAAAPPGPPPQLTGQVPPVAPAPGPEEAPRIKETIIGARVPLGKLAIELEDYWLEPDPPADVACAALSGYIVNNSAASLTLPQVEVTLLDGRQREYKPCKAKLTTNTTLNPLMRAKGQWAFQVPAKMPMWCAQFTIKEGKETKAVSIGVNKRTSENTQLAGSDDYRATSDELKAFASPRFLLQQQHEKELAKMDLILADLDATQKHLDKLARPKKSAETALANAKAAAENRAADVKDAEADLKDLESRRPTFLHDEPRWERQCGESRVRLERLDRDAASADKAWKEKLAQRDKIANQEKEEQKQFDALNRKFDAQRKVLEDLEKKMAE